MKKAIVGAKPQTRMTDLSQWEAEELQATTKALLRTIGNQDKATPIDAERLYWLMLLAEELVEAKG